MQDVLNIHQNKSHVAIRGGRKTCAVFQIPTSKKVKRVFGIEYSGLELEDIVDFLFPFSMLETLGSYTCGQGKHKKYLGVCYFGSQSTAFDL